MSPTNEVQDLDKRLRRIKEFFEFFRDEFGDSKNVISAGAVPDTKIAISMIEGDYSDDNKARNLRNSIESIEEAAKFVEETLEQEVQVLEQEMQDLQGR